MQERGVPDTASLRQDFEDYALLWALVLIVGVLSVLPLARLLLEAIAPNGQLSTRALTDVCQAPQPGARQDIVW
jgi:hypothetical protein